jgi:cysteine synthase A
VRLAGKLGPGKTIVTILCNSGIGYASTLWNPAFLRDKQLPVPYWLETENTRDLAGLVVPT